jgi:hypothetical protein
LPVRYDSLCACMYTAYGTCELHVCGVSDMEWAAAHRPMSSLERPPASLSRTCTANQAVVVGATKPEHPSGGWRW